MTLFYSTILVFILLGLWFASYIQLRHTFQWWCCRQMLEQQQQVEQMQDGILQDLFSIRRSLELDNSTNLQPQQRQTWLAQLEQIQQAIEQVNQHLYPAYVEASLPLALQYALQQWHLQHPQVILQLDLPAAEMTAHPDRNQFVLIALHQLLHLTDLKDLSRLQVRLTQPQPHQELSIQMSYPDSSAAHPFRNIADLVHLKRSFRLLTGGDCQFRQEELLMQWCFRW